MRLLALALLAAAGACSRQAEANYKHCLKLRVGMTREDMLKVMGAPEETIPYVEGKSLPHLKGRTAYEWSNPASMPGGDHISVADGTGKIESIRCSNSEITASVFVEPPAPVPSTAAPAAVSSAPVSAPAAFSAADALSAAIAAFKHKDLQKTLQLSKPLALAENADAQLLLGLVYLTADDVGLQGDKGEAMKWFYKSSRNKSAVAAALYVTTLKGGKVPAVTVAQEATLASTMGHPAAQRLQATLLLDGYEDAVAQDVPAGETLLAQAANGGDPLARLLMGERAQDAGKDLVEAYRWISLAARVPVAGKFDDPLKAAAFFWTDKDLTEAKDRLKKLETLLKPAQLREAKERAQKTP